MQNYTKKAKPQRFNPLIIVFYDFEPTSFYPITISSPIKIPSQKWQKYQFHKKHYFHFFRYFSSQKLFRFPNFHYLCTCNPKGTQRHICSVASHSPPRERANTYYLGLPQRAQILPYIGMVCGEPRGVWRKSALFCVSV